MTSTIPSFGIFQLTEDAGDLGQIAETTVLLARSARVLSVWPEPSGPAMSMTSCCGYAGVTRRIAERVLHALVLHDGGGGC